MTADRMAGVDALPHRIAALKAELEQLAARPLPPAGPQAAQSGALAAACRRVEALCRDVRSAPRPQAQALIAGLDDLVASLDALERKLASTRPAESAGEPPRQG